ncbi:MAG TPA: hypothetical protein VN758_07350 [Solirubrobacterales bacterium]|nr:hypothetical protein [Solirubrobacterales bacterium]
MAIAIVAGALANKPGSGGEAWVRLSWILGLQRLGLDVHFVENIAASACVDPSGSPCEFEDSVNLRHFTAVSEEFGLSGRATLLYEGGDEHRGLDRVALRELLDEAELLVNISGHLDGGFLEGPRKRVYVDLDPGFTQAWHADPALGFSVPEHDLYLTVAQNIDFPGCELPDGGLPWVPTLPPVLLEQWTAAPRPSGPLVLTTVATWRNSYGGLVIGGREMGLKHHQFRRLVELPERVEGAEFEIALDIHPGDAADLELLCSHGWRIVDPLAAAASPAAFRDYVRRSGAEFSVAQGVYVDTSSGWFSDRTAAYLASGRPAVVQDTGLQGEAAAPGALFAFKDLEGAVAGVEALSEDYEQRSRAAREFAEARLDSDRVLRRVLELALVLVLLALPLLGTTGAARAATTSRLEVVGQPQSVFDWGESACEPMMYPDLPARAFRDYRGQVQLLISHFDNFRLIGPSLDQLTVDCNPVLLSHRSALPSRFQDREWIGSIFTRDGKTVWALLHDEYQGNRHRGRCPSHSYYRCWYNAITLARSSDGGRSYQEATPPGHLVAAAPRRYRPEVGPTGVFTPSNIVAGPDGAKYALVRIRGPGAERGTCLIRTNRIQRPDSWRAWDGDGFDGRFSDPYETRQRRRTPCTPVGPGSIAEMAESLTYNTALGSYLLVGLAPPGAESIGPKATGIYFSTSEDLVHWSVRKLVTRAVTPHNYACGGPSPLAYPSLIDPESASRTFATSGAHPYLYYTQFRYQDCRRTPERDLMRVALEVSP